MASQRTTCCLQQTLLMFGINLIKQQLSPHHVTHNIICYKKTTVWNPFKPLLGSGTHGAILHDSRVASLWRTLHHTHTTQQSDGRFVVRLPTKMKPSQIGASRLSARQWLYAVNHRLETDSLLKVQYHSFMKEYVDLGRMEPEKSQEGKTTCYFYHITSLQGNKFHSKHSDCIWWRCQAF